LRPGEDPQQQSERWGKKWFSHKILGWSDAYNTEFQPVSLWNRGSNKLLWIKKSKAWGNEDFKELMKITWLGWILKVFFPALLLIVLPPATGGVVGYFTPPRGEVAGLSALSSTHFVRLWLPSSLRYTAL
jgi:hypothetical protein